MIEGLCQCGCGKKTKIATRTSIEKGWIKGKPRPFYANHGQKIKDLPNPVLSVSTNKNKLLSYNEVDRLETAWEEYLHDPNNGLGYGTALEGVHRQFASRLDPYRDKKDAVAAVEIIFNVANEIRSICNIETKTEKLAGILREHLQNEPNYGINHFSLKLYLEDKVKNEVLNKRNKKPRKGKPSAIPDKTIREVRKRFADEKITIVALGKAYNISQQTMSKIIRGEIRKSAGGPIDAARKCLKYYRVMKNIASPLGG